MEYNLIIADIKDIMYELKQATARVGVCIDDADRGINNNHVAEQENEPKAKTIENLFAYLIEAKNDMARAEDDLKDLYNKLENIIIPKYYNPDKEPWARMMNNAISKNAYYFNSHRMMRRYVTEAYIR